MKITTNSVGNYKPINIHTLTNIKEVQSKNIDDSLNVSKEEKQFFTKLYPDEKDQINNYHFYSKDGNKNGVSLGSLFDKRG